MFQAKGIGCGEELGEDQAWAVACTGVPAEGIYEKVLITSYEKTCVPLMGEEEGQRWLEMRQHGAWRPSALGFYSANCCGAGRPVGRERP